jgi:uncharacterized Fe-S cluster-containing protein
MSKIALSNHNCGLCGETTCELFQTKVNLEEKDINDCPFMEKETKEKPDNMQDNSYIVDEYDLHGNPFDFILKAVSGEHSARKIIRPFRPDLIEKLHITRGSIVMGRPMGAGCPVTHILLVYEVDELAGVLYTWAVGPKYSRNKSVLDIKAYNMIGFEGIAVNIKNEPKIGKGAAFLPGFCMLRLVHHGLVNKVLKTGEGILVRIEDIHIAR